MVFVLVQMMDLSMLRPSRSGDPAPRRSPDARATVPIRRQRGSNGGNLPAPRHRIRLPGPRLTPADAAGHNPGQFEAYQTWRPDGRTAVAESGTGSHRDAIRDGQAAPDTRFASASNRAARP
ncbi:hypothetical protein [Burkholderia alba]|uniref:hypothetical protein n=1 Tax=Burkholderia alba TaxID=2683677 RepID=UPI002B05B020|nr:hypothetical protein [Burkholderia alba]